MYVSVVPVSGRKRALKVSLVSGMVVQLPGAVTPMKVTSSQ